MAICVKAGKNAGEEPDWRWTVGLKRKQEEDVVVSCGGYIAHGVRLDSLCASSIWIEGESTGPKTGGVKSGDALGRIHYEKPTLCFHSRI